VVKALTGGGAAQRSTCTNAVTELGRGVRAARWASSSPRWSGPISPVLWSAWWPSWFQVDRDDQSCWRL